MLPLSVIVFSYWINTYIFVSTFACVMPPMECPNKNITFWLYTRSNKDSPYEIEANVPDSIDKAPWVKDAPIKVLIHGYTGYKDYSPNTEIRPAKPTDVSHVRQLHKWARGKSRAVEHAAVFPVALVRTPTIAVYTPESLYLVAMGDTISDTYMECCDYNIISVDYNPITREPCYLESARNTELVGKCLAQLIDVLVQKHEFNLTLFHVIGFSLGAHVAGYVSNFLESGKLDRISALDPALPLFVTPDVDKKIDSEDAHFVDVLHTNALEKGKLEGSGHIDFFGNGGMNQPGCKSTKEQTQSSCNHARAPAYFAESITTKVGFYGTKCYSWITFLIGWCEWVGSSNEVLFGEYVPRNESGFYFFSTNSKSPYARGKNKEWSRNDLEDVWERK